ncbi:hypothetical protein VH86_20690 [Pantoea sp. BL1]|uniref:hypothetical protein n=1 Tax=Pantoea sp. BL1 TaxID=1628190 RepID=UPI0005F7DCE2|nr:hypothetical protein [Pantoea sp. BL1]KJV46473.1 hypothetical protein VH86_20690 [Pantoea sp. BL1]
MQHDYSAHSGDSGLHWHTTIQEEEVIVLSKIPDYETDREGYLEFMTRSNALRMELLILSEKFVEVHGSYEAGMAELGEWLLNYADNAMIQKLSSGPISKESLFDELKRRHK